MKLFNQLLFFIFLFSISSAKAQELSRTDFDLGEISRLNQDVVELNLANFSEEDIFILRIEAPNGVDVKYLSKEIKSNQASLLRFKLNPKREGNLKVEVQLYFSHLEKPRTITFRAEVNEIIKNDLQACPSFRSTDMAQKSMAAFQKQQSASINRYYVSLGDNPESIVVVDSSLQEVNKRSQAINDHSLADLRRAQTEQSQKHDQKQVERRDRTSSTKEKKPRLSPEERRNQPSILEKLFGNPEAPETDSSKAETDINEEELAEEEEVAENLELENESIEEEAVPVDPNLLSDDYKANHVIFLIDASTSMREEDKMELLKKTMIELLNPLRNIDYLSIVTYSGEAEVILSPTSGIEKENIKNQIENIEADGSTQAVKGIKKALQVAKSNFIEGGNNQIILASDGAFDIGRRNMSLRKKISKSAKSGIKITVLGIKNERWTNKSLKEIAELGNGSLIHCRKLKDTGKVLEAVKEEALKR